MKTTGKYILKDKKVVACHDLLEWAKWFETADRHVADENVGKYRISTVFLGIDHNFLGGEPILFETMVFSDDEDGDEERYSTWEEAEKGHKKMVKKYSK